MKLLSTFLFIKKKTPTTHRECWTQEFTLSFHLWACFVIFNSMTASWHLYGKTGYLDYFLLSLNDEYVLHFQFFLMKNTQAADAFHGSFSNILLCGFIVTSQTKPWVLFPSVQGSLLPKLKQMRTFALLSSFSLEEKMLRHKGICVLFWFKWNKYFLWTNTSDAGIYRNECFTSFFEKIQAEKTPCKLSEETLGSIWVQNFWNWHLR